MSLAVRAQCNNNVSNDDSRLWHSSLVNVLRSYSIYECWPSLKLGLSLLHQSLVQVAELLSNTVIAVPLLQEYFVSEISSKMWKLNSSLYWDHTYWTITLSFCTRFEFQSAWMRPRWNYSNKLFIASNNLNVVVLFHWMTTTWKKLLLLV